MDRREFVATAGTALTAGLTGCLGDGFGLRPPKSSGRAPPDVACSDTSRPAPPAQEPAAAIQPVEYPGPPPCPLTVDAAVEYVTTYERAFRRNQEITSAGTFLTEFVMSVTGQDTERLWDDAVLVSLRYVFAGTVAEGPTYDSAPHKVTYYVDPTMVVRASTSGPDQPGTATDWPDPWESGTAVACYEGYSCSE